MRYRPHPLGGRHYWSQAPPTLFSSSIRHCTRAHTHTGMHLGRTSVHCSGQKCGFVHAFLYQSVFSMSVEYISCVSDTMIYGVRSRPS